jgi:hypothetical protein
MKNEMLKEVIEQVKKKDKNLVIKMKKAHEKYYDLKFKYNQQEMLM